MNLPEPLPEGDDLRHKVLYNWCNRLRDYCQAITLLRGPQANLNHSPAGTFLRPQKNPRVPPPGSFPFQVYPAMQGLGADYMQANFAGQPWWTMFLLRQGQYGPALVTGAALDAYSADPDAPVQQWQINPTAKMPPITPVTVAAGQGLWNVWLEVVFPVPATTGTAAVPASQTVYDGNNATAMAAAPPGMTGNAVAWPSFPAWDGRHWLIATIDVNTNAPAGPAIVRQFLREDILIPTLRLCAFGSGNYIYVPGYTGA